MENKTQETATLGGGCFWCSEAIFDNLRGIKEIDSGYWGGNVENPTYKEVCCGATGHAEAVRIKFDPAEISYKAILQAFFATHDPTTLNRQGNDIGSNYRSAIFYHSPEQKKIAEKVIGDLTDEKLFDKPIVTEVTEFTEFYPAGDYHKDYFENNPNQPYCTSVIAPKVAKFRQKFLSQLRKQV